MQTFENVNLQSYNTFGFHAYAEKFWILETTECLPVVFGETSSPLIIGGGSNLVLTQSYYPEVVINQLKGIEIVEEHEDRFLVKIASGEIWHEIVLWALSHELGGIENLSLIPGSAGAAPIQNIGAYGVEIKDVLHGVDYYRFESQTISFVSVGDARFGYRDSIFKNEWMNQGFITAIYLWLSLPGHHRLNMEYRALSDWMIKHSVSEPDIHTISRAVIEIRQSKLPDWRELGNAGSFFKNPVIPEEHYLQIAQQYERVPHYAQEDGRIKIPAAWLIQESGFKGQRLRTAGSYHLQPLVLVNFGHPTAEDVLSLKKAIQAAISEKFKIDLVPEVTIL